MNENYIYQWQGEMMVRHEMEEYRKEMEMIRLLNDASLSNPGLFERAVIAVGRKMAAFGNRLHTNYTEPRQAYHVTTSKYAA
jgi:hypothetical protein